MKRLDLVQLIIIIVGIFSCFFFLLALPQLLFSLYQWIADGLSGTYIAYFVSIVLVDAFYLLAGIYCIARSKHFATWIANKANLEADINFALDKAELLFVLFVGLGLYGVITHVPILLAVLFKQVSDHNAHIESSTLGATAGSNLAVQAITTIAFFALLYYAKTFADYFSKKVDNVEPETEIGDKLID